jgi:hypothetical protein
MSDLEIVALARIMFIIYGAMGFMTTVIILCMVMSMLVVSAWHWCVKLFDWLTKW